MFNKEFTCGTFERGNQNGIQGGVSRVFAFISPMVTILFQLYMGIKFRKVIEIEKKIYTKSKLQHDVK